MIDEKLLVDTTLLIFGKTFHIISKAYSQEKNSYNYFPYVQLTNSIIKTTERKKNLIDQSNQRIHASYFTVNIYACIA